MALVKWKRVERRRLCDVLAAAGRVSSYAREIVEPDRALWQRGQVHGSGCRTLDHHRGN